MSIRPVKVIAGIACATAVVAVSAFGVTAANAEPSDATSALLATSQTAKTYVAVGSDTIQAVYAAFADGYGAGAHPAIASIQSWDAFGSPLVQTNNAIVPDGASVIGRPNGSGDGRAAVSAAWNPKSNAVQITPQTGSTKLTYNVTPGSVDIARSSGWPSGSNLANGNGTAGGSDDNLTSIALARDAVTVVTNAVPVTNFTTDQLAAIYGATGDPNAPQSGTGNYHQNSDANKFTVGDIVRDTASDYNQPKVVTAVDGTGAITASTTLHPIIPASTGSGTRKFFLGALSQSSGFNATGKWVADGTNNVAALQGVDAGTPTTAVQENNGSVLDEAGDIAPFSAGQWIAQGNGIAAPNTTTGLDIDQVNGGVPVTGTAGSYAPGALYGDTDHRAPTGFGIFDRDVFSVVATSELASDPTLKTIVSQTLPASDYVTAFGFKKISFAADTTTWIHSKWENSGTPAAVSTAVSLASGASSDGSVTLTAVVSGPTGYTVNGGSVTFKEGATTVGTGTVANGQATLTLTGVTAGAHQYSASYAGSTTAAPAPFLASQVAAQNTVVVPQSIPGAPSVSISGVSISGNLKVGATLTAAATGVTSGAKLAYQWSANGADIAGATSSKLVLTAGLNAKKISVTVDAFAKGSVAAEATSAVSKAVAAGSLKVGTPTISGTAKVGKTLTLKKGTWTTGTKIKVQWLSNGKAIKGATKSTLKVSASLKGKKISVKVSGSLSGYTPAAKTSKTTKAVAK